jgi:hypothetical protein
MAKLQGFKQTDTNSVPSYGLEPTTSRFLAQRLARLPSARVSRDGCNEGKVA